MNTAWNKIYNHITSSFYKEQTTFLKNKTRFQEKWSDMVLENGFFTGERQITTKE